jgi:mono/diheme cytochrome c family protein
MRPSILLVLLALATFGAVSAVARAPSNGERAVFPDAGPCPHAAPVPDALRLPAIVPPGEPAAIEIRMLAYLSSYRYQRLGWCVDKAVRDTGPFVHGKYFGTHPAVRIYYSPEMIAWMRAGQHGAPPDGAVLIKEQYTPPAARWASTAANQLRPTDWTIMIRRGSASHDGWFWAEVYTPGMTYGGTQYPNAGFGLYCLRCHASAAKAGTFASLDNVRGFPGRPLVYRDDGSWRSPPPVATPKPEHEKNLTLIAAHTPPPNLFPAAIQTFPAEPLDTYVQDAHATHPFVTSDQCIGCHSAASLGETFGPVMWLTGASPAPAVTPAANVSEYGEWRWSPMALAGRDPVFYAQLASELTYLGGLPASRHPAALQQEVVNTCTQCHNAMGKRTFALDHPTEPYSLAFDFDANPSHRYVHYGGLARDGISCTLCHHAVAPAAPAGAQPLEYFLEHKINGVFDVGPANRIYGPFHNDVIAAHPMDMSLGAKPVFSQYVKSSQLCGSCHTIDLPVVDRLPAGHDVNRLAAAHDIEQNTYVEWINSRFQTDYHPQAGAKSCQDCHMSAGLTDSARGFALATIPAKIALVQDDTYPRSEGLAPAADVHVRLRKEGFRRHTLLGLNAFLLETVKQFPSVMGLRLADYMTGSSGDLDFAIDNIVSQARHATATVTVAAKSAPGRIIADVTVTNLTGHRFPSGVGFRRAFLDLEAVDERTNPPRLLFASGRTDASGRIVGADGRPLPSESFARGPGGRESYQEHHDTRSPIASAGEAQIFEELTQDAGGDFTTSFIRRDRVVKDNRLLPQGWRATGQPGVPLPPEFLAATQPRGRAASDPNFTDGKGHAVVRYVIALPPGVSPASVRVTATLYYQSWAPYFIAERTAGHDPASLRLRALLARLQLDGTPLAGWKLRIASASAPGSR